MTITPAQLGRLQTLCSQMARSVVGFDSGREARLAWAGQQLGREIASFSQLTKLEARRLIDAAQGELGHRAPLSPKARRTAAEAKRAGRDGRRGDQVFASQPQLASAEDLNTIAEYYQRLDWTRERFDAWLASGHSPIRPAKKIVTTAHANRVRWALKRMLKAEGRWVDWSAA